MLPSGMCSTLIAVLIDTLLNPCRRLCISRQCYYVDIFHKLPAWFLASICRNDQRIVMGQVLSNISAVYNVAVTSLTANIVKKNFKYKEESENDKWRVVVAKELLSICDGITVAAGFTFDEKVHMCYVGSE